MRQLPLLTVGVLAASIASFEQAMAVEQTPPHAADPQLESVVHFDFFVLEGARVSDASGQHHDGRLQNGTIANGKRKPAVQFDGHGVISLLEETLDPSTRPLTIGALCKPSAAEGVIASMGDATNGFSLYLKDAVPHFAVRANGELFEVAAEDSLVLDQWVHLVGTIDSDGKLSLIVNGWPLATGPGRVIPHKPVEGFSCGADPGSAVGNYEAPLHWRGLLEDVRLYWGCIDRESDRDELKDWADLPGCGCRR